MNNPLPPRPGPRVSAAGGAGGGLVYLGIFEHSGEKAAPERCVPLLAVAKLLEHSRVAGDRPVTHVQRFRRDWVLKKAADIVPSKGGIRGEIKEFSYESRMRLLHVAKNCNVDFHSMLTITYPSDFPRDGKQVKRDLQRFKIWLRREVEGIRGLWFLEFQKRGAPHFHFLLDVELSDQGTLVLKRRGGVRRCEKSESYETVEACERRASAAWYRIVGSGDEKHLRAGVCWEKLESEDAALRYAAMHAGKPKQKSVPEEYRNVGRFWGKIGPVRVEGGELEEISTVEVFKRFGFEAMSSRGRVKKYLWDASIEQT